MVMEVFAQESRRNLENLRRQIALQVRFQPEKNQIVTIFYLTVVTIH